MTADDYAVDVTVRFRDLDPMGHVNNAVYATYLEHARVGYYRDVVGTTLAAADTVLAHLSVDYRAPIELEDGAVEVSVSVPRLGSSSIPMSYELTASGTVVATAETVQVVIDRETGESVPIPEPWRETIESFEGH